MVKKKLLRVTDTVRGSGVWSSPRRPHEFIVESSETYKSGWSFCVPVVALREATESLSPCANERWGGGVKLDSIRFNSHNLCEHLEISERTLGTPSQHRPYPPSNPKENPPEGYKEMKNSFIIKARLGLQRPLSQPTSDRTIV